MWSIWRNMADEIGVYVVDEKSNVTMPISILF